MNAQLMARTAYAGAAQPTRTGRATEYELFARTTRRLKETGDGSAGFAALAKAVQDNRLLWNALAADVSIETNELPRDLRARIFYLAEFTARHSSRILAGEATVDALIDINTAVMRGLHEGGANR